MTPEYNTLLRYKQIEIDNHDKLTFFLEKHSTKEGVWGKLSLHKGAIDFIFLDGQGHELLRAHLNNDSPQISIPPAAWHKIMPVSESFAATLEFYCLPHRYFNKKYDLSPVQSDLLYIYQTYLQPLQNASILDVGCGSGRNLLYLAQMGHYVKGLDHNTSALKTIQDIAHQENLSNVVTQSHDLNQPLALKSERYDFILSTVTLQFLHTERIPSLLTELQEITHNRGYHCLVFPIRSELYPLPDFFTYLSQPQALYHFYQNCGWSILEYKESVGHLHKKDSSGKQVPGLFGCLLAQKP